MSETHRRRVVAKIYRFARVGLHTSRRRAADASAPLERAPTSERGVAGQLPRPARRSKKGPVRRGLRGRAARGGVFMPVLQLYNTTSLFRALAARGGYKSIRTVVYKSIHGPVEAYTGTARARARARSVNLSWVLR